jgi:monoamine oxidase
MVRDSGATLALSSPVARVEQDDEKVRVVTQGGEVIEAAHAVVAAPISTWGDIEWGWELAAEKVAAYHNPHPGRMKKIWVRVQGAPTDLIGFGLGGPLVWASSEYDLGDSQLMVTFSAPQNGLSTVDHQSVQAAVEHHFPGATVVEYIEHDWAADPYTKGTWMCNPPGQLSTQASALQASEGRVHFANADIATRWIGWIDGALESGARAASAIAGNA